MKLLQKWLKNRESRREMSKVSRLTSIVQISTLGESLALTCDGYPVMTFQPYTTVKEVMQTLSDVRGTLTENAKYLKNSGI